MVYPTIDTLCERIAELGTNCLLWKCDLQRFFRQLPLCPHDYPLISYRWRNFIFIDKNVPMGLTSVAYMAQRMTCTVVYIHRTFGYWSINYLDDLGSAEKPQEAWNSYNLMGRILSSLQIDEATEKAVPPTTRMEFLGNTVDTVKMTLEVSPERKQELMQLINKWLNRKRLRQKQLQSLIGKLSFVTNCVRPGRLFLSRMIDVLKQCYKDGKNTITQEFMEDLRWWKEFLPQFDGTAILWLQDKWGYDQQLASDASLTGGGAVFGKEYFHFKFDETVLAETTNISQREMLTILVSVRIWAPDLCGRVVRFCTDNQNCMFAINKGKSKDTYTLRCLREIVKITAKYQILLRCKYINTKSNTLPDALSRWYLTSEARRMFKRATDKTWKRKSINKELTII